MKRPVEKTNRRPRKFNTTLYSKSFDSIQSMIDDVKTLHEEFSQIFPYEDTKTAKDATVDVLKYFGDNVPDIEQRINLPMSVNVSGNRVSLKTNKFFTIQWNFNYDKTGNITNLRAGIVIFTRDSIEPPKDLLSLIDNLEANSWNIVENERLNKYRNKTTQKSDNETDHENDNYEPETLEGVTEISSDNSEGESDYNKESDELYSD